MSVPMSFGLIMAGFAGHAVFPTIYRDMKSPKQFNKMVNYTYIVTASVYMTVAACGYYMFGSETMQEVRKGIEVGRVLKGGKEFIVGVRYMYHVVPDRVEYKDIEVVLYMIVG